MNVFRPGPRRGRRSVLLAAVTAAVAVAVGLTSAVPAGSTEIDVIRVVDIDLGDNLWISAYVGDDWNDQVIFQHRKQGERIGFGQFVRNCEVNPYECDQEVRGILEDARSSLARAEGVCPPIDRPTGRALLVDEPAGRVTAEVVRSVVLGGAVALSWNFAVNELGQVDVRAGTAAIFFGTMAFLNFLYDRYVMEPGRFGPLQRAIVAGFGNAAFHIGRAAQERWVGGLCPDVTGFNLARRALPVVQDIEMGVLPGDRTGG